MRLDMEHMVLLIKLESQHDGSVNNVSEDNPELLKLRRFVKAKELPRKRKIYLGKRDEGILEMFNNGSTQLEMAKEWRMSVNQITGVIRRLRRHGFIEQGQNRSKTYLENIDKVKALYTDGLTYTDIAAEVGLSITTVSRYVKELMNAGKVAPRHDFQT